MKKKKSKNYRQLGNRKRRIIAINLLAIFLIEAFNPMSLYALSGGPSQPEMSSFEPVSTNQMVDLFSGDFTYNIPLLEVEGYPINIAYHGGVTMEDDASWVGLGWNINPGVINRSVRGIPDDFNGETIDKKLNLRPQREFSLGGGVNGELFGLDLVELGASLSYHNYKGFYMSPEMSLGISVGGNQSLKFLSYSGKSGFDIGITYSVQGDNASASAGLTYNSRKQSVKLTLSAAYDASSKKRKKKEIAQKKSMAAKDYMAKKTTFNEYISASMKASKTQADVKGFSGNSSTEIGASTYFPSGKPTMKTYMGSFRVNFGGEIFGTEPNVHVTGGYNQQGIDPDNKETSDNAYGYLYLENTTGKALADFNRDQDKGAYNPMMNFLPPSTLTYDILNVSGQGASGSFRPFRNDVGAVHDPDYDVVTSAGGSAGAEIGVGNLAKYGGSITANWGTDKGGNWTATNGYSFRGNNEKDLFEKVYFKNAGEITASNESFFSSIGGLEPVKHSLSGIDGLLSSPISSRNSYVGAMVDRHPRGKYISYLTASEADLIGLERKIMDDETEIDRTDSYREGYHVSEITHYEKNGSRYVYGIPAYNISKKEVAFTTNTLSSTNGIMTISGNENSKNNKSGKDHFFQETSTPAYAHSYLLTGFLSADYVDITQDGISDDDLGNAVKFNWKKNANPYRWRTPLTGIANQASYSDGYKINPEDNKGSYVEGTKEVWFLESIESRNFIAVFEKSPRTDGVACNADGTVTTGEKLQKLDYIKLYSKKDYQNHIAASTTPTPLKTVHFIYIDESTATGVLASQVLCQGAKNSTGTLEGKLTLEKIQIYYGDNEPASLSPYVFKYGYDKVSPNAPNNPGYNRLAVDRWGNYKAINPSDGTGSGTQSFLDYPYCNQEITNAANTKAENDKWASAWLLNNITLPSGGEINLKFESDDYTHVQDRAAMRYFRVHGAGKELGNETNTEFYKLGGTYHRDHLYIDAPKVMTSLGNSSADNAKRYELLEQMFKGVDYIKYKFSVTAGGNNGYENISGYAKVEDKGFCENGGIIDYNNIRIKLERTKLKVRKVNPIVAKSIQEMDKHLNQYINPGQNPNDGTILNIAKQVFTVVSDIIKLFAGPVGYYLNKNIAREFDSRESFVRLHIPEDRKFGGGHRVSEVRLSDGWSGMSGEASSEYGQVYNYNLPDGSSSGVASYEPLTGGDENPWRQPTFHKEKKNAFLAVNWQITEEHPFGESFLPPARVGYSRVEVSSIHRKYANGEAHAKSAQNYTVNEFYTAKNFPMQIKHTNIQKNEKKNKLSALTSIVGVGKQDRFAASQGYSFIFNDMHGKEKSVENYVVEIDGSGVELPKRVAGKLYNYKIKQIGEDKYALNNKVSAILRNGKHNDDITMGQEIDICMDSKYYEHKDGNPTVSFNLDGFMVAAVPAIVPTGFSPGTNNKLAVRNSVVTKIIQQYAILDDIVEYDESREVKTKNELYDGNTGDVLMTSSENEFGDKNFTLQKPAYWAHNNHLMGPAYINNGYFQTAGNYIKIIDNCNSPEAKEFLKDFLYPGLIDGFSWGYLPAGISGNVMKKDVFVPGDEVLVTPEFSQLNTHTSPDNNKNKAWVISTIGLTKLERLKAKGFITSSTTITGLTGSTYSSPCTDVLSTVDFENALVAKGFAKTTIQSFAGVVGSGTPATTSILHFGNNYDVCAFLKYYKTPAPDPSKYIASGNMMDLNRLLKSDQDLCNYLNMLFGSGTVNIALKNMLNAWFGNSNAQIHTDILSEIMQDKKLLQYMICNIEHPAILAFLSKLSCDQHLFDLVRFSLVNQSKNFEYRKSTKTFNETTQLSETKLVWQNYTTPPPNPLFVIYPKVDSVIEKCGESGKYDVNRNHYFLYQPVANTTALGSGCNLHLTALCDKPIGLASSWSDNTKDVKYDEVTNPPCPILDNAAFDAKSEEIVIFMDQWGEIVNLKDKMVKIVRSGRRNNLESKIASVVTHEVNEIDNAQIAANDNLISSSINTFSEVWHSDHLASYDMGTGKNRIPNPYVYGHRGNFRPSATINFVEERKHNQINLKENSIADGGYRNYVNYWSNISYYSSPKINRLKEDLVYNTNTQKWDVNALSQGWIKSSMINLYSSLGSPVQEVNALGIYNAEIMGIHNQAQAVGANAKIEELAFEDFEDYSYTSHEREDHFPLRTNMVIAYPTASNLCMVSTDEAHTGSQSLYLKGSKNSSGSFYKEVSGNPSNSGHKIITVGGVNHTYESTSHAECTTSSSVFAVKVNVASRSTVSNFNNGTYKNPIFTPEKGKEYIFSGWIKDAYNEGLMFFETTPDQAIPKSFTPSAVIKLKYYDNSGQLASPNDETVGFTDMDKSATINGWRKFSGTFTVPAGATKIEFYFTGGDFGCYYDDLRIFPADGNMTSYVYDETDFKLKAQLDENNYATFYEYDSEGNLIRMKKETERGIMMLKEYKKRVKTIN